MGIIKKEKVLKKDPTSLEFKIIKKFEPFSAAGYKVYPIEANHAKFLDPVIYAIEKDGKTMLYAHDTGYFTDSAWGYIRRTGFKFDYVSLDCTSTKREKIAGTHLSLTGCVKIRETFLKEGIADENTLFCLNHFSHNGGYTYDELVPIAAERGFIVSFDGMEVEF